MKFRDFLKHKFISFTKSVIDGSIKDSTRLRKTAWIFCMIICSATLLLIVNSRVNLDRDIVFGGADSAFVNSKDLDDPYGSYSGQGKDSSMKLKFPDIDISSWEYVIANNDHPLTDYEPSVVLLQNSSATFDERAVDALGELLHAARSKGFSPVLGDGYRSYAAQDYIYKGKASQISWDGSCTYEEALVKAKEIVACPGTSDHQTGLGIDILDAEYDEYDYSKMDARFYDWMDANCAEYGFIKRYPSDKDKVDTTGWDEPWHYRYVGKEAAKFIMENNLTLEEFAAHYK